MPGPVGCRGCRSSPAWAGEAMIRRCPGLPPYPALFHLLLLLLLRLLLLPTPSSRPTQPPPSSWPWRRPGCGRLACSSARPSPGAPPPPQQPSSTPRASPCVLWRCAGALMAPCVHACTRTHTHARTHTRTHTYKHARTHTRIHASTHAYTPRRMPHPPTSLIPPAASSAASEEAVLPDGGVLPQGEKGRLRLGWGVQDPREQHDGSKCCLAAVTLIQMADPAKKQKSLEE